MESEFWRFYAPYLVERSALPEIPGRDLRALADPGGTALSLRDLMPQITVK